MRRRRTVVATLGRVAAFASLLLIALAALYLLRQRATGDPDHVRLSAERSSRSMIASTGAQLAGTPDLAKFDARLAAGGFALGAPVFIRIFKREFELEVWLKRADRFELFATYPICNFSGGLGPKLAEGDRQSPEGFYTVDRQALNPNSRWHRSFNLGFPNVYDRRHQRTGSFLMVHGGCASIGCYAMTDPVVDEVWRLVTSALAAGQQRFHVHVYPFRMTDAAMADRAAHRWSDFWSNLKRGSDAFEATGLPPRIAVCGRTYEVVAESNLASRGDRPLTEACLAGPAPRATAR